MRSNNALSLDELLELLETSQASLENFKNSTLTKIKTKQEKNDFDNFFNDDLAEKAGSSTKVFRDEKEHINLMKDSKIMISQVRIYTRGL